MNVGGVRMKCKKHPVDLSSAVGVCASCLRERLFILLAIQAESQALAHSQSSDDRLHPKSHSPPHALLFPRSVSPYISHRRSDHSAPASHLCYHPAFPDRRFHSTPLVGPGGDVVLVGSLKKKRGRFSLFSRLFRSKSHIVDSEAGVCDARDSAATSLSMSWFSGVFSVRQRKQSGQLSTAGRGMRRAKRCSDRGMSPVAHSDGEEEVQCHGGSSGYSSESSQGWKKTPRATPTARRGGGRSSHSLNVSGISLCLSPLVRASPSRNRTNQKGVPPDICLSGEIRAQPRSRLSNAASFCKNRSRKLADIGRASLNR